MKKESDRECLPEMGPEQVAEVFRRIRKQKYLVHMLPNGVSAALCADGLAALCARPLMAEAPEEMEEIAAQADSCVINLGQMTREKKKAAALLLRQGAALGRPLVLDPVGCGASRFRLQAAQELLHLPWQGILKGNRSELYSIQQGKLTKEGVDSSRKYPLTGEIPPDRVYFATGETDHILWEGGSLEISHRKTARWNLVGTGCLAGAVTGACCSAASEMAKEALRDHSGQIWPLKLAALSASLAMAYVLEQTGEAEGYGTARCTLLDALGQLSEKKFSEWLRLRYAGNA